jgi:copper homeostasis protein (lipoprotein)
VSPFLRILLAAVAFQLVGLQPAAAEGGGAKTLGTLPASFEGDLPAADGPGIRYHLDLFPDRVFYLRLTYTGRGPENEFDDVGRWSVGSDGRDMVLRGGRAAPVFLRIAARDALVKLDTEGGPIDAVHDHTLKRLMSFEPVEPRLLLQGEVRYQADAASFRECRSGWPIPVALEEGWGELEAAYLRERPAPGAGVLATIDARIVNRPAMQGEGRGPSLVVERMIRLDAAGRCPPRVVDAPFAGTYWKVVRVGERAITGKHRPNEPHLVFDPEGMEGRVAGAGGCNRLMGGYTRQGNALGFDRMAGTMMACAEGMDVEQALHRALQDVATWRSNGAMLELLDAEGRLLVRMEARAHPPKPGKKSAKKP